MRFLRFLKLPITMLASGALLAAAHGQAAVRKDDASQIRGAVYVPSSAYNAPQLWKNFSVPETERDFHYAREIHLNALRLWASYEFWQRSPDIFAAEFDQMLAVAQQNGIRLLVSLFENDGVQPTEQNMWTTDPTRAFAIQSPGRAIAAGDKSGWEGPRSFVAWFMKRYRGDDRLLAVEIMNEPDAGTAAQPGTVPFAQSMFTTAKALQGTVPLTVGSNHLEDARLFVPLGLDVIQFHDNFPHSTADLVRTLRTAVDYARENHLPVWLTEWQRLRTGPEGFDVQKISSGERTADYSSMAATIQQFPIGNFFWCLMAKRAYLAGQRRNGTVNGLFWPDGAVTSLRDARYIASDPHLALPEKPFPVDFGTEAMQAAP